MEKYVIGNWKCNKGIEEAQNWLTAFARNYRPLPGLKIIIAPSCLCLPILAQQITDLGLENVFLAAQDLSPFPKGAYTGAVAADMLKGMVDYVIIGHSERRRYFHETDQDVAAKLSEAVDGGLIPIVCLDRPTAKSQLLALHDVDGRNMIIAYGPVDATMARVPESPQKVGEVARTILEVHPRKAVVYGGSLEPYNVKEYVRISELAGLFVGQASLDADSFLAICEQMAEGAQGETG